MATDFKTQNMSNLDLIQHHKNMLQMAIESGNEFEENKHRFELEKYSNMNKLETKPRKCPFCNAVVIYIDLRSKEKEVKDIFIKHLLPMMQESDAIDIYNGLIEELKLV